MTIVDLWENYRYYATHRGMFEAMKISLSEVTNGGIRRLQPYFPERGTPVYEFEWDLLIVLDTCRADALAAVSEEYDFLPEEIPRVRSVGSKTVEWMEGTFTDQYSEEMAETGYITFNGHSDELLDPDDFAYLGEVWRSHWNIEQGGIPPRPVTDHVIAADRELNPEYLIAHYKQPHQPYVNLNGFDPAQKRGDTADDRSGVFGAFLEGEFSREEVWEAYIDELRWALDEIELLLENINADNVAITADHGECFGEWGVYGHHGSMLIPELVTVPFVDGISATDRNEYEPNISLSVVDSNENVDDQLRALGYK